MAALLARPAFLSHLKGLYPESARDNPWYIFAAVAYAAANRPEAIPMVYHHAMKDIEDSNQDNKLLLVRRMRDALFKAGLINGYPKAINALQALSEVTPADLRDSKPMRDLSLSISQHQERGHAVFNRAYGETAASTQSLLDSVYPDLGWFCKLVGYGIVYSYDGALTHAETSSIIVASSIASDIPRQTAWHLKNAWRNGATSAELKAVRAIAIEVAKDCGVVWRHEVPDVEISP